MHLKSDYTIISLLVSGFQDKGANWKDQQLYYFSTPTGIRYQGDGLFRVVWPDGTLSADYYNLARVKQHCRDLARAIYPRQRPASSVRSDRDIAGPSDCDVAGAPENAAHSFKLGPPSEDLSKRKHRVRELRSSCRAAELPWKNQFGKPGQLPHEDGAEPLYPNYLRGYGNQHLKRPRALRGSKLGPANQGRLIPRIGGG